jgi:hypothetical protein
VTLVKKSWSRILREKRRPASDSLPIGTIAFYGPDDKHASKVAVGIRTHESESVSILERWYEQGLDVRIDPRIGREVVAFLTRHQVRQVAVADRIIGCPHEEGVDYPENEECPACPWWHGRDRWTGERLTNSGPDPGPFDA